MPASHFLSQFPWSVNMATHKGGKGQRGGDYRKRDAWPGQRDYNKSGSSSPGPRRSNSQWYGNKDKEYREQQHRVVANYLSEEWKKVESDLTRDQRLTGTVEYVAKTPSDIKDEELYNVERLKVSEEKPASSPD